MELLLRVTAAAVCGLISCLLFRRSNPELAAALSICTVVIILLAALRMSGGLRDLKETLQQKFELSETVMKPVLKCVAAGIVTRLTADLCRDSSQSAAAAAVELAGTLCALGVIMPLLNTMLTMVGGFL